VPNFFPVELKPETLHLGKLLSDEIASIQKTLRNAPIVGDRLATPNPDPSASAGAPAKTLAGISLMVLEPCAVTACLHCTLCRDSDRHCPITAPISLSPHERAAESPSA
jgi:hypothetical protein